MIPWIQVYSNLIKHPKISALADELKITCKDASINAVTAGMMVSLWLWAAQNATDGDLSKCSARAIAEAAEYKKSPTNFVAALKKVGWLDADMKLHDWDEYATLLIACDEQQREKTRKRVQRHRERKKAQSNADCNGECNVTVTPCNASTIPYHTLPYQVISGGGGDIRARAREASADDLQKIGLRPGEFLGVTVPLVDAVQDLSQKMFASYAPSNTCTALDRRKVFQHIARTDFSTGLLLCDESAAGLLEYAFEAAWKAAKPGNWGYIDGVMGRCNARGIQTAQQAREWDEDRPDLYGAAEA